MDGTQSWLKSPPAYGRDGLVIRSDGRPRSLGVAALAVSGEQLPIVRDGRVVELARVHEFLKVHVIERIRAKRIDARLRGRPLSRQSDFLRRSEILDAGHEQAVQRTGLARANHKRVPLDDPVDSVICVVFGRGGPVLLSIPLASPDAREIGQHREGQSTDRQRNLEHARMLQPSERVYLRDAVRRLFAQRRPVQQGVEYRTEGLAPIGQTVFDLGWHLMVYDPPHHTVVLPLTLL